MQALRLADHRPVPFEAQRAQVLELALGHSGAYAPGVEVLHPHEEPCPGGASEEPREQRRAQVAEMEVARRARGEAPVATPGRGGDHINELRSPQPVPVGPGASECWSVSQRVSSVASCGVLSPLPSPVCSAAPWLRRSAASETASQSAV